MLALVMQRESKRAEREYGPKREVRTAGDQRRNSGRYPRLCKNARAWALSRSGPIASISLASAQGYGESIASSSASNL
jgi:hypothetical protein